MLCALAGLWPNRGRVPIHGHGHQAPHARASSQARHGQARHVRASKGGHGLVPPSAGGRGLVAP